ncbi:MAG: polysaccharide export protein [Devosiaceae bacterium]|nr:polysaccharide export protein [Devosiaceae bacterium]
MVKKMRWLSLFALIILFPLSGCAINSAPATYMVEIEGPYTLDSGDVLRVSVYGDEELTNQYRVNDNGAIAFPLVGPIIVRGQTTQIAAARITAALANGFMRNPNVAVEVEIYRPFFIQGEVISSGQFPYVFGMTVRAAISTAGGFTDTANRTRVIVYRPEGSQMIKGNVEMDFPVRPGDTIVVLDRWL